MNLATVGMTILSAMITPAALISACGTPILSTSNRLTRVLDHVREASGRFTALATTPEGEGDATLRERERELMFAQLSTMTRRARLLQQGMARFYIALALFVAISGAIGLVSVITPI